MLQSLLGAIAETVLNAASHAILKSFGWENAFELVRAVAGLGLIAIGLVIVLLGH